MKNSHQIQITLFWMLFSVHISACIHPLNARGLSGESPVRKPNSTETRQILPSVNQGTGLTSTFFDGSWGNLEVRELTLEAPDSHVALCKELETWKSGIKWEFHCDIGTVIRIFRNSGLSENTITTLTSPPFVYYQIGKTTILPPDDLILALTPRMRSRLYSQIGLPEVSNRFRNATPFVSGGFSRLVKVPSGLSPQIVSLINHLTYPKKGGVLYFSDLKLAMRKAADERERFRIAKTVGREISLQAWLNLSESSNREEILAYWSAGDKNQAGRVTLEAILENRSISRLDLVHILPPFPKRVINTYPDREEGLGNEMPDCFATAFSFFSNSLSPRMLDSEAVSKIHSERYARATAPWQFGDLLMIQAPDGQWIHACNFIAGEIVFTKNGRSNNKPWVFQTINEVLSSYLVDQSIRAYFFRLNPEFRE